MRDWGREDVDLLLECINGRVESGIMGSETI